MIDGAFMGNLFSTRLAEFESVFAACDYNGVGKEGEIMVIDGARIPEVVLVAGHSVNHFRNGVVKLADRGTGAIVSLLCEITGCSGVLLTGYDTKDANFDEDHSIKDLSLSIYQEAKILIDLHGNKSSLFDLEIGGVFTEFSIRELFPNLITKGDFKIGFNERFKAQGLNTVTSWGFRNGFRAVQLEIRDNLRLFEGDLNSVNKLIELLANDIKNFAK